MPIFKHAPLTPDTKNTNNKGIRNRSNIGWDFKYKRRG